MSTEIKVPTLPESIADALVVTWRKAEGDAVSRDEILVEIETDKVVLEVPAEKDGVLDKIIEGEGTTVSAHQVIGTIETADAASKASAVAAADAAEQTAAKSAGASTAAAAPAASSSGAKVDIKVPTLPESIADALIVKWHKAEGDAVARDEILVDVETDKVVLEVPAATSGVLASIVEAEGETVAAHQVIGVIAEGASAAPAASADASGGAAAASDDEGETGGQTSPSVRKVMAKHGLTADQIVGSGKNGRITKEDVEKAAASVKSDAATAASTSSAASSAVSSASATSGVASVSSAAMDLPVGDRTERRVPMTRLRKRIAERLLEASQTTAMLTTFNEVNMQGFIDFRSQYKDLFEKTHGVKLGFMSIFIKAATEALKRYPDINASIDGDDVVYHGFCDVGVAVSSERGLVVPVLRNTENMSLADMEKGISEYAAKARDGKLGIDEMTGGTFTVSNGGVFGSMMSTPILNPPQSAILGMHATQQRPIAENGQVVIRPMMYVALSYDHRIVDGKGAVGFLKTIKEIVEEPARVVFDL